MALRTWLDAELGRQFDNGLELEILGGMNWIGFTITRDDANNRYNFAVASVSSDDVSNDSSVSGTTVSDALDSLLSFTESVESTANAAVPNSRTLTAGANLSGGGDLSANRSFALSATLTGITSINGATLATPTEGAQITTTATINVSQGSNLTVTSAGGAYAITLGTTGSPIVGDTISLICSNSLANAITVTNGGAGGGNIGPVAGTMPAGAKRVYDYRYDGTNWSYAGSKLLV